MSEINNTNWRQKIRRGVVIESEEIEFKIVSSRAVELWCPEANFALACKDQVIFETKLDPILLARIFGIPTQSSATVDSLIEMFNYPLTIIEALLFAAFNDFVYQCLDQDNETLLYHWGLLEFEVKIERGFSLIGGMFQECAPKTILRLQEIQCECSETRQARELIHERFLQSIGGINESLDSNLSNIQSAE